MKTIILTSVYFTISTTLIALINPPNYIAYVLGAIAMAVYVLIFSPKSK